MKYDALPVVYSIFSERWSDFDFRKSRKSWVKKTGDRVMLLVQLQQSRWGARYYLNFGAYFLDVEPIDRPLSNLPKSSDWHLFARYENFKNISTSEYNILFSLEEDDAFSLEARCAEVASFADETILPRLTLFGNLDLIEDRILRRGPATAFDPFRPQMIARQVLLEYVKAQSGLRSS